MPLILLTPELEEGKDLMCGSSILMILWKTGGAFYLRIFGRSNKDVWAPTHQDQYLCSSHCQQEDKMQTNKNWVFTEKNSNVRNHMGGI